jgi:hypothetical protein
VNGNGVGIELVSRLTNEFQRSVDAQTRCDVLAPFERYTNDFRVECRGIADRGIPIDDVLSRFGIYAIHECITRALRRRRRRRFAAGVFRSKKAREGFFERALGRR